MPVCVCIPLSVFYFRLSNVFEMYALDRSMGQFPILQMNDRLMKKNPEIYYQRACGHDPVVK